MVLFAHSTSTKHFMYVGPTTPIVGHSHRGHIGPECTFHGGLLPHLQAVVLVIHPPINLACGSKCCGVQLHVWMWPPHSGPSGPCMSCAVCPTQNNQPLTECSACFCGTIPWQNWDHLLFSLFVIINNHHSACKYRQNGGHHLFQPDSMKQIVPSYCPTAL